MHIYRFAFHILTMKPKYELCLNEITWTWNLANETIKNNEIAQYNSVSALIKHDNKCFDAIQLFADIRTHTHTRPGYMRISVF